MRSECPSKRGASGRKAARPVGLPMGVDSNADIERRFQAALAHIKRSRQFSITEEIATSQAVAWGDLIGAGSTD